MDLLTPNPGLMIWTALAFLLLYAVLYRFAWGPLSVMLNEREQKIKDSLEQAEKAQAKADEAIQKQEAMMVEARQEAQKMVEKAKKTADSMRDDLIKKAKDEADALLERAKGEIASEKQKAADELKELTVDLSLAVTEKAIGKALSKADHQGLVNECLQEMGAAN